jgi:tetratricopeptide (TPR) repeat protein
MRRIVLGIILVLLTGCGDMDEFDLEKVLQTRPDGNQTAFDYSGTTENISETAVRYLEKIRKTYGIEILVAAVPTLEGRYTINEAAVEMFSNWRIGETYDGRGVLLLFVEDEKQVRLEIGYELEDVFTDLFAGHAQDKQLRPHYSAGHLDTGLIAVLEELEIRAMIKAENQYSRTDIESLDDRYLSQGAGARYELDLNASESDAEFMVNSEYSAGETPRAAWETLIRKWRDRQRDHNLGVLPPTARLAYRDFANMSDSRFDENFRTYAEKKYTVHRNSDFAVIYFGKKTGWDNSPFLFCRTQDGWQFDLVHQRRYIRMGTAPNWGVEFSEHPYMELLMDCYSYQGQDIPFTGEDLYDVHRDTELAEAVLVQESLHASNPDAFAPAMALGRLYALTAMGRKAVGILKKAEKLDSEDPRPWKYLSIAHVDAFYQYDTALKHLDRYVEKTPEDGFGHNFRGYLLYLKGRDTEAADAFETALSVMSGDTCYSHYYLTRVYYRLFKSASLSDPLRKEYETRFQEHLDETRSYEGRHPLRTDMLDRWIGNE